MSKIKVILKQSIKKTKSRRPKTFSGRGARNREKGHAFERVVKDAFKLALPEISEQIERAIQSRGAEACDIQGVPYLWIEAQDSQAPTPLVKLEQAERDLRAAKTQRLPVAVTHKKGARSIQITLRICSLCTLLSEPTADVRRFGTYPYPITMDFQEFLVIYTAFFTRNPSLTVVR